MVGVGVRGLRLGVAGFLVIELPLIGDVVAVVVVALSVTQRVCAKTLPLFHRVSLLVLEKFTDLPVGFAMAE